MPSSRVVTFLETATSEREKDPCQSTGILSGSSSTTSSRETTSEGLHMMSSPEHVRSDSNTSSSFPSKCATYDTTSFIPWPNTETAAKVHSGLPSRSSHRDVESMNIGKPWRNKGRRRLYKLAFLFLAYAAGILLINGFRVFTNSNSKAGIEHPHGGVVGEGPLLPNRQKRDVGTTDNILQNGNDSDNSNCTPRSIHNFPDNFMSISDTQNGGVIVHILIALYMFAALAIVCDDYFVPALEHICEDLGLQADVAGATFMAAGSSAPEFMTSVVGVFFAESDVGVGTIVGSAVFNILFIIGVCGVFAGMVVELTWYPLMRDTLFYLLSVLTLFLIIRNQKVEWYEAMIMVIMYGFYILVMYFNRYLETHFRSWVGKMVAKLERQPLVDKPPEVHIIPEEMRRARAHSRISQSSISLSQSREYEKPHTLDQSLPEEQETAMFGSNAESATPSSSSKNGEIMSVSEFQSVWTVPEGFLWRCLYIIVLPIKAVLYVSVPDSRRPGIWARLYLLSFIISVAWISGLTYIMVWMVTIAGDALDIPDTVMGLTLLAAGTSVPDCLSSVFVARDGYGDMAVSNSLGSNVFDILLCLGLPWLIESAINNGDHVEITSGGLIYSALTLLATVIFLLGSMAVNRWRLTKTYGILCLVAYLLVVTLSCLYELNIFGDVNPPSCPR